MHGLEATVAHARHPSSVIDTLTGWVDLYENGAYEMLWPNPFPGVADIAGAEIEEHDDYEFGVLRLTQHVPLPEGGWADDATFEAIFISEKGICLDTNRAAT